MNIELLDPTQAAWSRALGAVAHDVYHRPCYMAAEAARTGTRAEAFVATDGERRLFVPYLVRSCAELGPGAADLYDITSPQGYASPLTSAAGRDPVFVAQALEALRTALRDRGRVCGFLRMHPILCADAASLFPDDVLVDHGPSVAIDLGGDEADLFAQMKEKQREAVRRAERLGYTATFEPLADVAGAIHALYVETMDRVQAGDSYRLPLSYFDGLGDRPDTFACVVRHRGDIAAGCVFFEREGIVQAHLGGTFDAHLLASPFALSLHAAAVRSQGRGGRWLHLGGGVGGARDNLLRFKASLGRGRFRLSSLRLVADPAAYARLLALRGFAPGAEPAGFFPAYRAPRPEPQPLKQAQLAA
jgi:hypothetical protein